MSSRSTARKPIQSRNRYPCKPCQTSKRKCDHAKPRCSRCQKLRLECLESSQTRWRIVESTPTTKPTSGKRNKTRTGQDDEFVNGDQDAVRLGQEDRSVVQLGRQEMTASNTEDRGETPIAVNPPTSPFIDSIVPHSPGAGPASYGATPSGASVTSTRVSESAALDVAGQADDLAGQTNEGYSVAPLSLEAMLQPTGYTDLDLFTSFEPPLSDLTTDAIRHFPRPVAPEHINNPLYDQSLNLPTADTVLVTLERHLQARSGSDMDETPDFTLLLSLWEFWVYTLAPDLTPASAQAINPLLQHLVPQAAVNEELLVAVLFFSAILKAREVPVSTSTAHFLQKQAERFVDELDGPDGLLDQDRILFRPNGLSQSLHKLTKTVVYCMGFMAAQDDARLSICLEYAVILCQHLFKENADRDDFLFLVKLFGFMQNALLFRTSPNHIIAPDYLTTALELPSSATTTSLGFGCHAGSRKHFQDVDLFSGLSHSTASVIWLLGSLLCKKTTFSTRNDSGNRSEWKVFESQVDGLEARLRRHVAGLSKLPSRKATYQHTVNVHHTLGDYLHYLNEAAVWSAWVIFMSDLKGSSVFSEFEIQQAAEQILDTLVLIPQDHSLQTKTIFPIAVGAAKVTKPVYREFVLNRLNQMPNLGITDVRKLGTDLERFWDGQYNTVRKPFDFTSLYIF